MSLTKNLAFVVLSAALVSPTIALAEPVPALAPQNIPPEALRAIDSVNHAMESNGVPLFDSRALSIGLGALAGVLVYNLMPAMGRAVPGLVGRAAARTGVSGAVYTMTASQVPMMTSTVLGALVGDYIYRSNNRVPSVSAEIAERIRP
jgi:hypothetical protein